MFLDEGGLLPLVCGNMLVPVCRAGSTGLPETLGALREEDVPRRVVFFLGTL